MFLARKVTYTEQMVGKRWAEVVQGEGFELLTLMAEVGRIKHGKSTEKGNL